MLALPCAAWAQQATLEITVRAAPVGGRAEFVRGHPFYLLRESLETIEAAAAAETPPPSLEEFADTIDLSDGFRAWVKRTGVTELRGEAFLRAVTDDDLMEVPEFFAAYIDANQSMVGMGFPRPKAKLSDREKKPEKWKKAINEYKAKLRAYVELHPDSREGMDRELIEINPGPAWSRRLQAHRESLRKAMLRLIHSRYLAAEAETDLEGRARFSAPPGRYYVTNLWEPARAGSVRLTWELPIELPAAQSYRFELNNANALDTR